jgi:hypothetical protein
MMIIVATTCASLLSNRVLGRPYCDIIVKIFIQAIMHNITQAKLLQAELRAITYITAKVVERRLFFYQLLLLLLIDGVKFS